MSREQIWLFHNQMKRHVGHFSGRTKVDNEEFSDGDIDILLGKELKTKLDLKLYKGFYSTHKVRDATASEAPNRIKPL